MRAIGGTAVRHLDARHYVRGRADHNVRLDPLGLRNLAPVLLVKPPLVYRRREAGRIDGKVRFGSAQGSCALLDQRFENRRDGRIVKDA